MVGITIGHRYKLQKLVGGGGMAEVYRAFDQVLNQEVAVKILRQQYVHDDAFVKRFRREAHSVASLSHENVVSIYDVGQQKNIYYIVMEYIDGYTLKELIQKKGKLPVKDALEIAKKICSAIEHAHQHQIIHRDIKPQNILIGKHGEVKVTDFGIARAVSAATITHTGSVLGSVHYLSPEQAKGGFTDEKTDLYSFGIVLYEMMTGNLPFSGDSPITVALKHLQEGFTYPKELNPKIPQSVENIILKALIKDPTKRYSSATEMLEDLKTALDPDRINEPRIEIDTDETNNEQPTLIIPALSEPNLMKRSKSGSIENKLEENKRTDVFFKGLSALILFIIISVFSYQFISAKFIVPEVEVPQLVGKSKEDASVELTNLKLKYNIIELYDATVKEDLIIKQEPENGTIVKITQPVTLYVSLGKERIPMPTVLELQGGQAEFFLKQHGFNDIEIVESFDENAPIGTVFRQEPIPDQSVIADEEKVFLFVSKGKEKIIMPDLIGKTISEAEAILTKINLNWTIKHDYTLSQEEGKIYRQFPFEPGREVISGDKIDLFVSQGYPEAAKKIYSDMLVPLDEGEEAEITIEIRDSRGQDVVWIKEKITGPKFYDKIELILMPNEKGRIKVYKNNSLFKSKTVQYY